MLRSRPFLMFTGQAEAALALYAEAFADFRLLALQRHPEGAGAGVPGQVRQAIFLLGGTHYLCFDSLDVHDFTFSPSISLFVECSGAEQFERAARVLGEDGHWLMPVGDYDFSNRYGWVQDRFGVSWQLSLGQMPDP
ncbi:VOC family protein [Stenotrophomonas maltophilia]|uniref:VOC family protein n=1 Tax=Stenotrophomonas TaxID=40323 RepID=UPI0013130569|nr:MULTISPECIES: VOC family protein [Stenotrophomonas]MCU1000105.1 VOC family protein [Stenotrophomonas maltophilia]MCU1179721.1 VOC family protein [Stenotrophomonas maltophilia]